MEKRAQAAMEFLTTYGWAVLVVLVAIGALAYFGVMNPSKTLPERCFFGSAFNCKDYKIQKGNPILPSTPDAVTIYLTNSIGQTITVTKISGTYGSNSCTKTYNQQMASDTTLSFVCEFASAAILTVNDKIKVPLTITYQISGGSNYDHTINGEVYGTVQQNAGGT